MFFLPIIITPVIVFPPLSDKGGALVTIYLDGSVLLAHGGVEIGQGLNTKMIQVDLVFCNRWLVPTYLERGELHIKSYTRLNASMICRMK